MAGAFNSFTLSAYIDSTKFLTFLLGLGIAKAAFLALEAACFYYKVEAFKATSFTFAYAFSFASNCLAVAFLSLISLLLKVFIAL